MTKAFITNFAKSGIYNGCLHSYFPYRIKNITVQNFKISTIYTATSLSCFQGMIALILETIDKFSQYKSKRQFAYYAGEEAANKWDDISSYLYLLLGTSEQVVLPLLLVML